MSTQLENILMPVKEVLLDGLKFPNGRTYNREDSLRKLQISIPIIVSVYNLFKKEPFNESIFYLARTIDIRRGIKNVFGIKELVGSQMIDDIQSIANEGRMLYLMELKTDEERIESARLYKNNNGELFAAQLKDPKRGCSASICSNCYEPNAFADYKCEVCDHELIQAHGMPDIEDWEILKLGGKLSYLKNGYMVMARNIKQNDYGDWRGQSSSLNRLKEYLVTIS